MLLSTLADCRESSNLVNSASQTCHSVHIPICICWCLSAYVTGWHPHFPANWRRAFCTHRPMYLHAVSV